MICPLYKAAAISAAYYSQASTEKLSECDREQCAQWDPELKVCTARSIATSLGLIEARSDRP